MEGYKCQDLTFQNPSWNFNNGFPMRKLVSSIFINLDGLMDSFALFVEIEKPITSLQEEFSNVRLMGIKHTLQRVRPYMAAIPL
jgi:hypothetical protein